MVLETSAFLALKTWDEPIVFFVDVVDNGISHKPASEVKRSQLMNVFGLRFLNVTDISSLREENLAREAVIRFGVGFWNINDYVTQIFD